ncbi:MAG TPA: ATP-binding protein [Tepidisphaeraceae bacterium]|nr:ATP-binding protein [Tepidisphaeraceae bacterium]
MIKRVPKLHLSLAAKCQLLFGAAVILIISAALFVPWQRMEQLTEQLNEKAAAAVARTAIAEHVMCAKSQEPQPATAPAAAPSASTTQPEFVFDGQRVTQPRLIPVSALNHPGQNSTRFEELALERLVSNRRLPFVARTYDNEQGYRYAQPLPAAGQCLDCHANPDQPAVTDPAIDDPETTVAEASTTQPAPILGIVSVDIPTQVSGRQQLLNRVFILTAGLLAGTLAIIIFYLVTTRLILQPVRVLQETAEKVSEGDLNIRSDINTGDEFQVLSETFNTMLSNLKTSADQLRAVNKSLDLKLGQLAESNVALYESNRLKSEFLANVSHELRTPLNSILGFAELLKDSNPSSDAKVLRYIQNINNAGHNLLDLINDLLDLAKIEAGRMEVRSEQISLADLFEALIGVLKPLTESKGLTIIPIVQADVPIIQTDPAKLQQILYNFLSNAIKFSPAGGRIELMADLAGERVLVKVVDHGPGIDSAAHATIFEKFRQIDGSVTRQHSGTGLGLAISKELSVLLGGSIGVDSALGVGATFWIALPLKNVAGPADVRSKLVLS